MADVTHIYGNEIVDAAARQDIADLEATTNTLKDDLTAAQVELAKKANTDGYYEEMTVGNAEQLVSTVTNADDTPYNFRTTAGSADVGDRAYVDAVVGGTVCLNQLVKSFTDAKTFNGVTFTANGGAITVSGTATSNAAYPLHTVPLYANHVYFLNGCPYGGRNGSINRYALYMNETNPQLFDVGTGSMQKQTTDTTGALYFIVYSGQTVDFTFIPQLFDVTKTFGSTIADYIYSLETATAGAGVAWLKANAPKIFNSGYIPYNPGELVSVTGVSEKRNVGFNQWDEEFVNGFFNDNGVYTARADILGSKNAIRVLPNTTYCFKGKASAFVTFWRSAVTISDAPSSEFISRLQMNSDVSTFTTPSGCHYIFFNMPTAYGATYNHDICINLHWDGEKDGTYEPYTVHTYAFDPTVELRGVPKLKDGKMYFDGDRYLPDGTVQRRYGVVDLGSLTWEKVPTTDDNYRFRAVYSYVGGNASTDVANMRCTKYIAVTGNETYSNPKVGITGYMSGGYIFVYDPNYLDAATFKTAMSGVYLVYEKANASTETATPYNPVEIVDDFGTEEFITTSLVPVGHETRYAPNLRAKLEMAPDSPDCDGVYVVQQSNGENTYVSLGSTTVIQGILARLTALEGNTNEG